MIFTVNNIETEYIGKTFIFCREDEIDDDYHNNINDYVFRIGRNVDNRRGAEEFAWFKLSGNDRFICDIRLNHDYRCFPYDISAKNQRIFKYNHKNKEQFALEQNHIFI